MDTEYKKRVHLIIKAIVDLDNKYVLDKKFVRWGARLIKEADMSEMFEEERLKELMSYNKTVIIKMYARTLNHLRNIVSNLDLWKCEKCGNWSMKGHACYECRKSEQ